MREGNLEKDFEQYLVSVKLWEPYVEDNHRWIQRLGDEMDRAAKRSAEENSRLKESDYAWWTELVKLQQQYGFERDLFGEYIELKNMTSQKNGQFFTPMSICKMMCAFTHTDIPQGRDIRTISDCASGSGRMMIAHAAHMMSLDKGYSPVKYAYYNQDIDYKAFVFSTLNAALRNLSSVNVWGDTLAVKEYKAYITVPTRLGVALWMDKEHEESKNRQERIQIAG
jgi:type I restriction-modification system DNA methylase subunit